MKKDWKALEYVNSEDLSSKKKYDEVAKIAVSENGDALALVKLKRVVKPLELIKLAMKEGPEYLENLNIGQVHSLDKQKRRRILWYLEGFDCHAHWFNRNIRHGGNCPFTEIEEREVKDWLSRYQDEYN